MEYNQDAVRLVKPYVDAKVGEVDTKLSGYIVTAEEDPETGTAGQLAVVDGTLKVCTVASDGDDAATWKAVSHAS